MKRFLCGMLLLGLSFCTAACSAYFGEPTKNTDGKERIVVYTPFPVTTAEELSAAFTKKTGIEVEQILEGTTKVFARLRVEKRNPRADVWYGGGGMIPFITATKEDLLEPYIPPEHKDMPFMKGNLIMRDREWRWLPIGIISMGYCYNPQMTPPEEAPKTWDDLADPKWKGQFEMWDPASSGTSMLFLCASILRLMGPNGDETAGWEYLTKVFQNLRRYTREGKPAFSVARGETRIGLHFEHQYLEFLYQQSGGGQLSDVYHNLTWYLPPESPVIVDGLALVKGGPNPEGGKKFIDFCLSDEGQRIVNRFFFSIDPTFPPPAHLEGFTLDKLMENSMKLDIDWMADNYDRLRKKWQNDVEATVEE